MSHLAPRPSHHSGHRRNPSNSQTQTPDRRIEIVAKLENSIGEVLEALKAYKSPQQQSAHQNANQMFQQRVLASQGRTGNMSDQDWLGTMMQCLNESMRTQQSSFVRNTTLDVALKIFAAGVFETLGLAYFQEPFDKCMAARGHSGTNHYGIPSPPREMGPSNGGAQRPISQQLPLSAALATSFPSAHHQLPKGPVNASGSGAHAIPPYQMHSMPAVSQVVPLPTQQNRPLKRTHQMEHPKAPMPKRAYTSDAIRQAAGPMGQPSQAMPRRPGHNNPARHRLCVDFWDVQQEQEMRRRQAILGYGGKWYVFQCHQHQDVIFFKTAEGARHHMITQHALPNQHVDFLDMVQELGVEVMNCDVALAEKNNMEAVNMWNQLGSSSATQQGYVARPAAPTIAPPFAELTAPPPSQPRQLAQHVPLMSSDPALLPPTRSESPAIVSLSDDEVSEEGGGDPETGSVKQEVVEKQMQSIEMKSSNNNASFVSVRALTPSENVEEMTDTVESCQTEFHTATKAVEDKPLDEADEASESREKEDEESTAEGHTAVEAAVAEIADHIPDLTPDSPESSDLSEPPCLEDLESFVPLSLDHQDLKSANEDLEEGEIDESCIHVSLRSPAASGKTIVSPEGGKQKKRRRITAVGSKQSTPRTRRKKLPSTPQSSHSRSKERQSLWSPPQEAGPSAHDQFKTKACKKCSERFYFRAQLATHMESEHPEVVILE
ncbi:hypothetical protein PWT90_00245 [Aphanocladium album]|nr:hypothetical protein PWT90_00245 [Aphanocladium album]